MTQQFFFGGRLPGMNEILSMNTQRRGKAINQYAKTKAKLNNDIALVIRAARIRPVPRAHIRFIWHEADRRRNPDNIACGMKFLIDGLVTAKVLENDGWGQIVGFTHAWEVCEPVGVEVALFTSPEQ